MNAFLRTLSLLGLALLGPILAQAQPAPKIVIVDIAKLYDSHWLTLEQNAKLTAEEAKANQDLEQMVKEGTALVEQYKSLSEQAQSPTLTADAKKKVQDDAQKTLGEIQQKQLLVTNFRTNTSESLKQRIENFRNLMLENIVGVAKRVGQAKGANLILDKSGPSVIGVPAVIFADDTFDITEDVMKEINKEKPAAAATPAGSAPAAPAGPAPLTVPGAKK